MDFKLSTSSENKSLHRISKKLCSSKRHSRIKKIRKKKINMNDQLIEGLKVCHRRKSKNESGDSGVRRKEKRRRWKRKKMKNNIIQDEVSSLQRRVRYLLIKMKLELNLIEAYSRDGWKGQSKEKIKPEKELQRAMKQILKCKLRIRDTIRQMDLMSSEGRIGDSLMSPDGSVFHEHIVCAKCQLREAFPDNDIILCDGTCNCAFHQKCLDPPLENIPPSDQGWLCKICERRMEILEAINAHIGTSFTMNSSWEDIFKEATTCPNSENPSLNPDDEWPSEDSNDEDYDPEICASITGIKESMADISSSSSLCSSDEVSTSHDFTKHWSLGVKNKEDFETLDSILDIDSDEASDREITSYRRPRRDVDYRKLHDEMFGKEFNNDEQLSEDEDWGPQRKKRRRDRDVDTAVDNCGDENGCTNLVLQKNISYARRKLFRIPKEAVHKLRQVFSENELPSREIRENLSQELGISAEKITKWFKNARYAALKLRKAETTGQPQMVGSTNRSTIDRKQMLDEVESMDSSYLLPLSSFIRVRRNLRRILKRKNSSITKPLKKPLKEAASELPTDTIQKLRNVLVKNHLPSESVKRNLAKELDLPYNQVTSWFNDAIHNNMEVTAAGKSPSEGRTDPQADEITEDEQLYLVEIERLFDLEDRLQKLRKTLLSYRDDGQMPSKIHPQEQNVMYVPVVEIREKVMQVQEPVTFS